MNRTKGYLSIGIVLSVLWLLNSFFDDVSVRGFDMNDFVILGLVPVVIFWGLVWIVSGFRNIVSGSRNEDNNNQDK